jgi:hypothetical protein
MSSTPKVQIHRKIISVADGSNHIDNVINATLAYECLTSVPFNGAVATRFMQYLYDSVEFQSNLAYLKNPPTTYQQPAVDLLGGLAHIQAKINNGAYANEYEFEAEIQALIYSTHDGHLYLSSGILGLFSFGSQYPIASVSVDGIQLPKVYLSGKMSYPFRSLNANQQCKIIFWQVKNQVPPRRPQR